MQSENDNGSYMHTVSPQTSLDYLRQEDNIDHKNNFEKPLHNASLMPQGLSNAARTLSNLHKKYCFCNQVLFFLKSSQSRKSSLLKSSQIVNHFCELSHKSFCSKQVESEVKFSQDFATVILKNTL